MTRFMLSKMLTNKIFVAVFIIADVMLSLMYYNTISSSMIAHSILQAPWSTAVSILLGTVIALGIMVNIYVMKVIMSSGQEARKAATRTVLSMLAGAVGCASSLVSVLLSLGIGIGSGVLAFLSANLLLFFLIASIMSLVSIKLAAMTLANVSSVVRY